MTDTVSNPAGPAEPEDEDARACAVGDVEEAELEGDRPIKPGTALTALQSQPFRRVYAGWGLSNIGTWMQNVVLGAWAYEVTESTTFVGILIFAQLGPLLLFSLIGGNLADRFDRRRLLIIGSSVQCVVAFALAAVVATDSPSRVVVVAIVFAIGIAQAVVGPTFSSALPTLVPKKDLAGAVSLTSTNMNLSRVLGAPVGTFIYATWGASWVFGINAVTYIFIVLGVMRVHIPRFAAPPGAPSGWRRILQGFTVARQDHVVGRALVTCATFSFFCLIFVGEMPALAELNLGIDAQSTAYGWLYATFGLGALTGALSIGTVFAGRDLAKLIRVSLLAFAVLLAVTAIIRQPAPAYFSLFVLGVFYFMVITSLSTVMQQRLDEHTRGRVMALWIMAFGGTVPLGVLFFGPIIGFTNMTTVLFIGVAVALFLVWYADLRDREPAAIS